MHCESILDFGQAHQPTFAFSSQLLHDLNQLPSAFVRTREALVQVFDLNPAAPIEQNFNNRHCTFVNCPCQQRIVLGGERLAQKGAEPIILIQ